MAAWKWTGLYETVYNAFYDLSVHFMKNVHCTTCTGRFMLSSGTRFSSFALTVFKWHEGKVGHYSNGTSAWLSYRWHHTNQDYFTLCENIVQSALVAPLTSQAEDILGNRRLAVGVRSALAPHAYCVTVLGILLRPPRDLLWSWTVLGWPRRR